MIVTSHRFGGVTATVYRLNINEAIVRHQHDWPHTTETIVGMTEVEVFDGREVIYMLPGDRAVVLPEKIDHEIRAAKNGTIIINMASDLSGNMPEAMNGGIAMDDGTVVHDP